MSLIFVYNANSGKINAVLDAGHKLFSPSTYPCSLCALTYDTVTENKIWKSFRKESEIDMVFLHKDEFGVDFPDADVNFPVVLKLENESLIPLLDHNDLNNIPSVEALIQKLKSIL